MDITFSNRSYKFQPWKPEMGRVLVRPYAFDSETTLIDDEHHWIAPAYVIGAAFDGTRGLFVRREHVAAFFGAHRDLSLAMHNAPFDLSVIHTLAPDLDIYDWVDHDRVHDTQLLHKLYMLGTEGHVAGGKGESTLEFCARRYLGIDLPKDTQDSRGKPVRLSYGQWLNQPPNKIEQVYLEYLATDAIATHRVCVEVRRRLRALLNSSSDTWGFVSPRWMEEQIERWGLQTHHIQLKAAIVLDRITANGLHLDRQRHERLVDALQEVLGQRRQELTQYGYLPGQPGSTKALEAILQRMEWTNPEINLPRTETGRFSTAYESLTEYAETIPFIKLLLEFREVEKLLNAFLSKMGRTVVHPSFNALTRTGRTTSFGEINAQNLPTDDRVRSCFIPSPGHVFLDLDFKTIEMATLAQTCLSQLGLNSKMAEAINNDQDLHLLVASRVTGKPPAEVSKAERKHAKPINFGKPGGMSNKTLRAYAKVNYGVDLTEEEVGQLSDAWFDLFPEMRDFLADARDLGLELATFFDLTPTSHHEHTGDPRFLNHPDNVDRGNSPHAILGSMLLKVMRDERPATRDGRDYNDHDIDYFWSRVVAKISSLPRKLRDAVNQHQPSKQLHRAVMSLVGLGGVFTLSGRLRAKASYCARHNTMFQGLAADGLKLAMWKIWRAGYRIVNEIHDQLLIEVPINTDLKQSAEHIRALMIEGMREVVPDVQVDASFAATARWHKDAEPVYSADGEQLLLWKPPSDSLGEKQRQGRAVA